MLVQATVGTIHMIYIYKDMYGNERLLQESYVYMYINQVKYNGELPTLFSSC